MSLSLVQRSSTGFVPLNARDLDISKKAARRKKGYCAKEKKSSHTQTAEHKVSSEPVESDRIKITNCRDFKTVQCLSF